MSSPRAWFVFIVFIFLCYLQLLQPYLSVMLNKGSLEVLLFMGSHSPRRIIRRPEQGIMNDGREHSLRIERLPGRLCACLFCASNAAIQQWSSFCNLLNIFYCLRSFAVQVDEEAKKDTTLPNDQPVTLHRIFLGGIPAEVEQTSNRVNVPFQGCIWNLMINAVYVTLTL